MNLADEQICYYNKSYYELRNMNTENHTPRFAARRRATIVEACNIAAKALGYACYKHGDLTAMDDYYDIDC